MNHDDIDHYGYSVPGFHHLRWRCPFPFVSLKGNIILLSSSLACCIYIRISLIDSIKLIYVIYASAYPYPDLLK